MTLTDAQRWALEAIRDGYAESPARLGARMAERPGAKLAYEGRRRPKAQGLGLLGGGMMARLEKAGLCTTTSSFRGEWHPTRATITRAGLNALQEN